MCMGNTHAHGGIAAGLATALLWKLSGEPLTLPDALACSAIAAGGALLSDLDTPASTASRSLGRVSQKISYGIQRLSRCVFTMSATPADHRYALPVHRGLTHTLAFAALFGIAITAVLNLGWIAGLIAICLMTGLASRALLPSSRDRGAWPMVTALIVTGLIVPFPAPVLLLGMSAAAGFYSHILLDGCTTMGVPLLWPIKIRGMRWRRTGLPRFMRFHTNGRMEPWAKRALGIVSALEVVRCLIP